MSDLTAGVQEMAAAASDLAGHWRQGGAAQRAMVLDEIRRLPERHRAVLTGWIAGCLDGAGEDAALAEWLLAALPEGAA